LKAAGAPTARLLLTALRGPRRITAAGSAARRNIGVVATLRHFAVAAAVDSTAAVAVDSMAGAAGRRAVVVATVATPGAAAVTAAGRRSC
jgi:hypothetical protein